MKEHYKKFEKQLLWLLGNQFPRLMERAWEYLLKEKMKQLNQQKPNGSQEIKI
jgi:hypothetical protein